LNCNRSLRSPARLQIGEEIADGGAHRGRCDGLVGLRHRFHHRFVGGIVEFVDATVERLKRVRFAAVNGAGAEQAGRGKCR